MKKEYNGFVLNVDRAREVARAAVSMLKRRIYPFDKERMPDKIIPDGIKRGSLEHAFLIFYACSTDSMRQAKEVYRAFRSISQGRDLSELFALSEEQVRELLHEHLEDSTRETMGNPAQTIAYNSLLLYRNYGNNPVNIVREDVDSTLKELDRFRQVGLGKAALIMKNYVRFGFWQFPVYNIPIKVDRHVVRISLGTGVVEAEEEVIRADRLVKPLMNAYREITREGRISGIDLDDALWVIGSYLCSRNRQDYCRLNCPLRCARRPDSDNNAVVFQTRVDKRKGSGQGTLF